MTGHDDPAVELLQLQTLLKHLHVRARDLDLDLAHARDLAHDRARDLAFDLDRARALTHALTHDLDLDLDRARDLNRGLVLLNLDLKLRRSRDLILDRALDRANARELVEVLESAQSWVAGLVAESQAMSVTAQSSGTSVAVPARPGGAAVRVSRWAVRLLPPPVRVRYADELLDELYALADDGASRWRQLACALRQVLPGAWQLRTALRAERVSGEGL